MRIRYFLGSFVLLWLALLFAVQTVAAENRPYPFTLTPLVGLHGGCEFGRLIPLPNTADVPGIRILLKNKGLSAGVTLGYTLSKNFELQGSFIYSRGQMIHDVGIGFTGVPLGEVKVSDTRIFSYSGNVLYGISIKNFFPFVSAGVGAITFDPDRLNTRTRILLNFGVGIKLELTRRILSVLEIKDYVSFFDYAKDFGVLYVAIYSADFKKTQHRLGIHIGLSYLF